jgi:hypothetical protein
MVTTRNSRWILRILGLAFALFVAVIVLAADRDPLTWLFAAGAFTAGRCTCRRPRARARAARPRRDA